MMRYFLFLLAGLLTLGGIAFAQHVDKPKIPQSIQASCLVTNEGYIDTCPQYRQAMKTLNQELYHDWLSASNNTDIILYQYIKDQLQTLPVLITQSNDTSINTLFLQDYQYYITQRFLLYLQETTLPSNPVQDFFQKTYFDQDQSGISLERLSVYSHPAQQFDRTIVLQLSARNFTNSRINNIEDVYCFTTINHFDYIYPMNVKPSLGGNSITNLIINLDVGISPLFEHEGKQSIACTLVYTQDNTTVYTNRIKLEFDIKAAQ